MDGLRLSDHTSAGPLVLRLEEALVSCSKSIESGDFSQSTQSISELVEFLNSITDSAVSEPENEDLEQIAFEIVSEINRHISSPSLDQEVMDALSFELPRAVVRFGCVSTRCLDIAESIVDRFAVTCSPRDTLTILCEALASPSKIFRVSGYFAPLLSGIAKVFVLIRRRHFEQAKAAVPVILNVLKATFLESDDEDMDAEALFNKALGIADSIQAVSAKLEGKENKKLHALFGLFVLQIMALLSISMGEKLSSCLSMVIKLSNFLGYCGLSYLGLITGDDIEKITSIVIEDNGDDYMNCFSHVNHGATLAVIWCHLSNEIAVATGVDLSAVKTELQNNQIKRWQAVGMLRHIFSCPYLPWELKKHAINFLLWIMDSNISHKCDAEHMDYSPYMPSLYAALQAIEIVIMYSSDAVVRKNAFSAFKKVLADIPASPRFDILIALTKNSDSSSMIAILIDCVREQMLMEYRKRTSTGKEESPQVENKACQSTSFWSVDVLELVELVLRPSKGGPSSLPDYSDAVLSVLNLYRFVLMTELSGKTNYTGVLSKENLEKAYNTWLLPLRTLVTGIVAENQRDYDQLAFDTVCALNPLQLVLYRCIELVEEKLKHST